ncbi:GntR family transcriptional regulator [Nocardioides caldifontis]|uniref:GntR family transcriptional regulator n=1 Tax=Nocardioides caldifontis TaxID=2588938 RepID=UPI0013968581|nr:GntR family transcriptional regulator [Nocardioides caldifontis]
MTRIAAPRETRTAHEFVYNTLRAAVLNGTLAGGARLVQSELAQQLGVSTTPVREALRDLATEGLVVLDPHRGAVVRSLDLEEVREVYELRMTLEPLMVRRVAASMTDEKLERAAELHRQMADPRDPQTWSQLNRDFHALFSESAENSRLAGILASLRDSAAPYVAMSLVARPEQAAQANAEHAELLDAYRTGDVDRAIELTLDHLRATLRVIEEHFPPRP